jgi:hypothetical protein
MIHGSKISCIGIVGDGCGGGREFVVENEIFYVYDPLTKEKMTLLEDIHMPKNITKKGCTITIECENEIIKFDLSALKKV